MLNINRHCYNDLYYYFSTTEPNTNPLCGFDEDIGSTKVTRPSVLQKQRDEITAERVAHLNK